jgi:transposase
MWLQWDWGDGPLITGRKTQLFAAWLAWSRFRVVIPVWDQQMGTLTWCIDQALRAVGGAPTYLLTDNARTVTMDHVAGIPVRHPEMVALGRHYGCKVETCVPFDPESNAYAERFVLTARTEVTDRMLIFGQRHLQLVLARYEAHYNGRRPDRSHHLRPPRPDHPVADLTQKQIKRRPILGGLINEYEQAA